MSNRTFIILNIIYFVFDYFVIPYLPNPVLFGFMPFQMFCYGIMGPIACVLWGTYVIGAMNKQTRYE